MNKIMLLVLVLVSLGVLAGCTTNQTPVEIEDDPEKIAVYFFWGDGCPHCATQKPFLEELETKYNNLEIKSYETWKNSNNVAIFQDISRRYGITPRGVPTTFIGDKYWIGFNEGMKLEMEAQIRDCIENGCVNPGEK